MSLTAEERRDVITYRLEKAQATLKQIESNLPLCYWELIANRLYYAAYYAVSALLIAYGYRVKSHEGTVLQFGLHFAKEGIVPPEMGKFYNRLLEVRLTGDYSDNYHFTEEDVMPLIKPTEQLIEKVSELARERLQEPT